MTITAKTHIAEQITRAVPYERKLRDGGRTAGAARDAKWALLVVLCFGTGCNLFVGFKDVSLEKDAMGGGDDDGGTDGNMSDAMIDAKPIDAMIDAPPPKIFTYHTDASFAGNFGGRANADIKCQDKYNLSFTTLGCQTANIHAFLQVDDTADTIARLQVNYPIPLNAQILRATDGVTPVSSQWSDFVNPNAQLLSPISTSGTPIYFWSGRGAGGNLQCTNWTSNASTISGNAGDVTRTNAWTSASNFTCNNFNQKLLCFCW